MDDLALHANEYHKMRREDKYPCLRCLFMAKDAWSLYVHTKAAHFEEFGI